VTVSARLAPLLLLLPRLLAAQGVTTAAIQGTVRGDIGSPILAATVRVTNASNGHGWQVVTPSTGRYLFETVEVGGPYRIEVRAIGFAPEARSGILLALGERLIVDFALRSAPMQLPEVTVTATGDPELNPGRTGPAEIVSATTITGLPNPRRDFVTLTLLSPQAAFSPPGFLSLSGISVGGQNRFYNSMQIDGGVNQDLYLGRLPGRVTLPRPVSLDALQEVQVLAAPFDVRHGGFAGGLVNAVTKSGTNALHGSVFGFLTDGTLVGKGPAGNAVRFTTWQYGGSVGGPIVRDRAHYFLSLDVQHRVAPDAGPLITDTAGGADLARIGISHTSAVRFQDILRTTYGLDPGTLGPVDEAAPAQDLFGKITVQLGTNSHLEASQHYVRGAPHEGISREYGFYGLSSQVAQHPSSTDASRLIWTRGFGSWSNELVVSYLRQRDECRPRVTYPIIFVSADQGSLGAGLGCLGLTDVVDQRSAEITDHVTVAVGGHVIGFGAHGALQRFKDTLLPVGAGLWEFASLDSLETGQASFYQRGLPGAGGTPGIDFRVHELGIYLQDRWSPTPRLTLTAGVRVDLSLLPDAVATNDSLQAALGIDTRRLPSGNALSPRLGISHDLDGRGGTFLRGGIGLFGGPPPYRWVADAYRGDGTRQLILRCVEPAVPSFDPINQPATCGAGPKPRLGFFDRGVRFPHNLKAALGVDHRLPGGVVATLDLLYTRAVHQLYVSDANLLPPTGVAQGEGGRPLYGSIDADGTPAPRRRDPAFGQVIRVSNRSGDRALSFSAQLHKKSGDLEGSVLYAHTRARDRMSLGVSGLPGGLTSTPLDGTLEDRRLGTSLFEIRHRVLLQAAARLPYGMRLSVLYAGASGTPYTYVIEGDANADGGVITPNDIVYVPRNVVPGGDISLVVVDNQGTLVPAPASEYARLDAFIREEPCLREQRGHILARNSCPNPWFGSLNARLTKAIPTVADNSLELSLDVYNVLNLISPRWGLSRATTTDVNAVLLSLVGYDATAGRGVYQLALPARNQIQELASRWQLEFSVRYGF
jgi:Carboxypeptidase regulatory-like domain/TonB dependent receptor